MLEKGGYKREFKRFLYKENVVELFLGYTLSSDNDWKEEFEFNTLKEYLNKTYPEHYVSSAFDWNEANEDFNFWAKLSDKWCNYLRELEYAKCKVYRATSN